MRLYPEDVMLQVFFFGIFYGLLLSAAYNGFKKRVRSSRKQKAVKSKIPNVNHNDVEYIRTLKVS